MQIILLIVIHISCNLIYGSDKVFIATDNRQKCELYFDKFSKRMITNVPEIQPEYDGGLSELYKYFNKELNITNEEHENIGDFLIITFIVDENGKTRFQEISQNAKNVGKIEFKAKQSIYKMSLWKPGKCNGRLVAVKFNTTVRW